MKNFISTIKLNPILSLLLGGFLLSMGWYIHPIFTFIGFFPLFCVIDAKEISNKKLFISSYLMFLFWNVVSTWWIVNSTWIGAFLAFVLNSLLMCLPVMLSRYVFKIESFKKLLQSFKLVVFLIFWISFEYLHMQWDLTWPWLNLGNTFSKAHYLVQWYDITGALGGSFWVVLINILIFRLSVKFNFKRCIILVISFSFPVLISLINYYFNSDRGIETEVAVVQPNIDPHEEKFSGTSRFIPYETQLNRLLDLSKKAITVNTKFIFWPETSIPQSYDEDLMSTQPDIFKIRDFLGLYPNLSLIAGADSYKIYMKEFDKLNTSRYQEGVGWYDYFNTAVFMSPNKKMEFYHKSKLVPGVECMPFPVLTKYLNTLAGDLGFIPGSLGTQMARTNFINKDKLSVAPIICYESIFGEFVSKYVKNGANFLTIITNDGWWGNTPGHTQHLGFARLRAIETRKSIARAANTGISCFINQRGDIYEESKYGVEDVKISKIKLNNILTFYVENGDYIGIICVFVSLLLILLAIIFKLFIK